MSGQIDTTLAGILVSAIVALSGVIVWAVKWGVQFLATRLVEALTGLRSEVACLHRKLCDVHNDTQHGLEVMREDAKEAADISRVERRALAEQLQVQTKALEQAILKPSDPEDRNHGGK